MRKAVIFDPLEWNYVITLARRLMPMLNFSADPLAAKIASDICGKGVEELGRLDWSKPVIYMPPFKRVVEGTINVAVEGYTAGKMSKLGVKPDVVVTDLDFDVGGLRLGDYVVVHAHGDNIRLLLEHARRLDNRVMTVQTWPLPCTANISGFTDGDRAVYLAYYMGAKRVVVNGAYFDVKIKRDDHVKALKLELARHLIKRVGRVVEVLWI